MKNFFLGDYIAKTLFCNHGIEFTLQVAMFCLKIGLWNLPFKVPLSNLTLPCEIPTFEVTHRRLNHYDKSRLENIEEFRFII